MKWMAIVLVDLTLKMLSVSQLNKKRNSKDLKRNQNN